MNQYPIDLSRIHTVRSTAQSPPSPTHPIPRVSVHRFGSKKEVSARCRVVSVHYSVLDNVHRCLMNFMPDTHHRRRRDSTRQLSCVGGVYGTLALVSSCSCRESRESLRLPQNCLVHWRSQRGPEGRSPPANEKKCQS